MNSTSLGAHAPNEVSLFVKNLVKVTNGLDKINLVFNNVTHRISQLLLFLLMFLTTGDVVGRYFFNKPITGTYEVTGLGLAVIIFFSLGMAQIKKDHIVIDFLTNQFPLKIREGLRVISSFVLFILLVLTTWQMMTYTERLWKGNDLSGDLGLPMYIFTILSSIGLLSFTLAVFLDIFKSLLKVVQKNES